MSQQQAPGSAAQKFPLWRYAAFGASDMGYSIVYFWVVSYLTIFYTDVFQIPVLAVSVMMLVTRIFDAVNDPLIGGLLDNGKSKMGRYRPWIIIGGLAMVATTILLFWAHPDWSDSGKITYMYLTYVLCTVAMTVFYMALGALGGTISADSGVRMRATGTRCAFSGIGNLVAGYAVPALLVTFAAVGTNRSYLYCVAITGAIAVPMILFTGCGTRELIRPAKDVKVSFKTQLKALVTNKPMLILAALFFLQGVSMTFRMTAATYYFIYVVGNTSYFSTYNLLVALLNIAGGLTAMYAYRLFKDKAKAMVAVITATILCLAGMFLFPAPSPLFFVFSALSGYSNGAIPALAYAMLPEAIDYTQYKDGVRIDGFLSATASFTFKCGMAVAGSAVLAVLSAAGYVANAAQSPAAMQAISLCLTLIPAGLMLLMGILMACYPLKECSHDKIMTALRQRGDV